MARRVVVRGSGSIGSRHAAVFMGLGAQVTLWPVRPRPGAVDPATGAAIVDDRTGPGSCAEADLVVIATDTARHVSDAAVALDAGCARLLVEKPVAPTAIAAEPLTAHARAERVLVAAPLRAHQGFRRLAIELATLPGPHAAYVHCQSWLPDWRPGRDYRESYSARAEEGGVLRDLVHEIDYAAVLFGPPRSDAGPGRPALSAVLTSDGPLELAAEEAATLLWTAGTATVAVRLDYVTRPPRRGVIVTGPGGALSWDVLTGTVRRTDPQGTVQEWQYAEDLDRDAVLATQARALLDLHPEDRPELRLAAGAPATLAEGVQALRICDDARTAAGDLA